MVFPVKRRSIILIFWIRNIVKLGNSLVLLWVGFVVDWLVNLIVICIGFERIDLFPIKSQNVTRWFLVIFVFLTWTISYQVTDRLCYPWTGVLLLLMLNKHSFEKLQISQLVNCYSFLLFYLQTFQNNFFYFTW